MTSTKTCSVIIVSWNAKAYLMGCLRSIATQEVDASVEVIVVDNASSDGSPDAVREHFPGVTLIQNPGNYGFSRANNIGIEKATGQYLFLINSDVVVHPGCFQAMLDHLDAHPEIGMLGPKVFGSDGRVQRSCMGYPSVWNSMSRALAFDSLFPRSPLFGRQLMTFWNHDERREVDVINGCFWLIRRDALAQVGLLDERFRIYGEDIDWCKRFHDQGWKIVFYPDAQALHYGGASSANAPLKFYLEMQRANYQYWAKHHALPGAYAYVLIGLLHHVIRLGGESLAYAVRRGGRATAAHKARRSVAAIKWLFGAMVMGPTRRLGPTTGTL